MPTYIHRGRHPDDLASGRVIGPGEQVDDDDLTHTDRKRLVDTGILLTVDEPEAGSDEKPSKGSKEARR